MSYFKDLYKITHDINTNVIGEDIEDVIYSPTSGDPFELHGIFDNNYEGVDASSEVVVSSNICVFSCHLSHFEYEEVTPRKGDGIEIVGISYTVTDAQEDGQGGVKLILHKV